MQTFRDRAVQELLYDPGGGDEIRAMLEQSPTNSRINQAMAWWCEVYEQVIGNWRGNWRYMFGDMPTSLQRRLQNLDAFGRVQAINMAQARSVTEQGIKAQQEAEHKGGLLGLFK